VKSVTRQNVVVTATLALTGVLAYVSQKADSQETPSSSESESASITQVWQREDEYGRVGDAGELDAYKSLFHEKFIGWPCDSAHPKRKTGVGEWVREIRDKHIQVASVVTREGAEDFGNVVIVHYRATEVDTYPDGHSEGEGEEYKFTHTWMRTGDTWQIVGGMCASLRAKPK